MNFFHKALKMPQNDKNVILRITFYAFWGKFDEFFKILHKIWKILIFLPQISYFMTYHSKIHIKVSKWQKCDFAHYVLGIFKVFLKILHKIWKNLTFLPLISYFMTYYSKIYIKVSKFNNKLSRPNFCPFWTPVNFLKLIKTPCSDFLL